MFKSQRKIIRSKRFRIPITFSWSLSTITVKTSSKFYDLIRIWQHIFVNGHKNVQVGSGSGQILNLLASRIRNAGWRSFVTHLRNSKPFLPAVSDLYVLMTTFAVVYSASVLWIHEILVRIRIRGSIPLTNGSGSCSFRQWPSRYQKKSKFYYFSFLTEGSGSVSGSGSGSRRPKNICILRFRIRNTAPLNPSLTVCKLRNV